MRIPIATVNLTFQWGHDKALLLDVAQTPVRGELPLLLEGVEARTGGEHPEPINVQSTLGSDWHVVQNLSTVAKAGSWFAIRKGHGLTLRDHWMFQLSPDGPGVQDRHQQCGIIDIEGVRAVLDIGVGHFPVPDTDLHDDALRRMGRWWDRAIDRRRRSAARGVNRVVQWGGDPNMTPFQLGHSLGAPHWFGDKPMANVWSSGLHHVMTSSRRVRFADHRVLTISGEPRA